MRKLGCLLVGITSIIFGEVQAQVSQANAVYSVLNDGLGPQAAGPAPGKTFTSIYGSVDMNVNYLSAGKNSLLRMQSGNVWASKLGVYGQEDLGGGWLTLFRFESGLNANNGSTQDAGSLFNRASFVGIQHKDYGQLTLGRQFSSVGSAAVGSDVFFGNGHESIYVYLMAVNDLGGSGNLAIGNRLNNTLRYVTPTVAKYFKLDFSASLKQNTAGHHNIHAQTVSATYTNSGTSIGVGYAQSWCDPAIAGECANANAATPDIRTDAAIVSMQHDFGPVIGNAAYVRLEPKGTGGGAANVFSVGLEKIAGVNFYRAAIAYRKTTLEQNYAYGSTLGVEHFLSRRTALYTRLTVLKNGPKSGLLYNYDATSGNILPGRGSTVRDISIGMYHNF